MPKIHIPADHEHASPDGACPEESDQLRAAVELAALGYYVLPVHTPTGDPKFPCSCSASHRCPTPGKHPRREKGTLEHGASDATTDLDLVRHWWTKWPHANVGIALAPSGLVDVAPDSLEWLTEFRRRDLPGGSLVFRSGGGEGHEHHLYRRPEGCPITRVCRSGEYDLLSNGLIVTPPSLHASGARYEWVTPLVDRLPCWAIVDTPAWVVEVLAAAGEEEDTESLDDDNDLQPYEGDQPPVPLTGRALRLWWGEVWVSKEDEGEDSLDRSRTLYAIIASLQQAGVDRDTAVGATLNRDRALWDPPKFGNGRKDGWKQCGKMYDRAVKDAAKERAAVEVDLGALRPPKEVSSNGAESTERRHYHRTDDGNANRLVNRHGAMLRHSAELDWLTWEGDWWHREGAASRVVERATETVIAIYRELSAIEDDEQRQALAKHAASSESRQRLAAMVDLARHKPAVRAVAAQFDTHPWKLTVPGTTFDLRTGETYAPRPEDYITKGMRVSFDPHAQARRWREFLERVLPEVEVRAYLQRAAGYCLTGDTREKCIFVLWGPTDSGKTTLLELLGWLLGDYAQTIRAESLMARKEVGIPNDLAKLRGARFVWTSETEEGRRMATALVKTMTGRDRLSARFLHQEWFDFEPEFKLWFATNHKPVVRETSDAAWNRIKLIPFLVSIPKGEQDGDLPEVLRAEAPGILNWLLEGFREWRRRGLDEPAVISLATRAYRQEMDLLTQFLEERTEEKKGTSTTASRLHRDYVEWCRLHSETPLSLRRFGESLSERGMRKRIEHHVTLYEDLWLIPD